MKVKDIKNKVAAKVAKGKNKVAKKCGKCALVAFALLCIAGCLYPTAPSRSQNLTIRDCNIRIYGGGAETGDVARVEIASQAMAIETSGTETQTNTATQTPTVSPKTDVNVGGAKSGTGVLEKAVGALTGDSTGGACKDGACVYTGEQ